MSSHAAINIRLPTESNTHGRPLHNSIVKNLHCDHKLQQAQKLKLIM